MEDLQIRTSETELPGGRLLRVSSVESPRREGRSVVLERLPGSAGARSIMEPNPGERLVVSADVVGELVELLEEVSDGE